MSDAVRHAERTAAGGQKIGIVDLVWYGDFTLDAPVDEVWRRVIDYPSWQGYTSIERIAGKAGEEGETNIIGKPEGELAWQPKYCRTVKLDPGRKVIWRIYTLDGPGAWECEFNGTVEYRFEETPDRKTKLSYQVIKEFQVPYSDERDLEAFRKREDEAQTTLMREVFPKLQALVSRS